MLGVVAIVGTVSDLVCDKRVVVSAGGRGVEMDPGDAIGIITIEGRDWEFEGEPLVGLITGFVDTAGFPDCGGVLKPGGELFSGPGIVRVVGCCGVVLGLGNESVLIKASSGRVNFLEKDVERPGGLLVVVVEKACPVAKAGVPVGDKQSIVVEEEDPSEIRRTGSEGLELGVFKTGALMGLEGEKLEDVLPDTLAGVLVEVADETFNVLVAGVVGVWETRRTGSEGLELGVFKLGAPTGLEDEKLEDVVLDTSAGVLVEVADETVNALVAGVIVRAWEISKMGSEGSELEDEKLEDVPPGTLVGVLGEVADETVDVVVVGVVGIREVAVVVTFNLG